MKRKQIPIAVVFTFGLAAGLFFANHEVRMIAPVEAKSEQDKPVASPVKARERDFYAPNSEDLGPDEMRVIACGTGMPTARPKQAATCFLLELGNGDKFLFDIGTGSAERVSALQIPYNYLDKVFLSHLHSDTSVIWMRCLLVARSWAGRSRYASGARVAIHRNGARNTRWIISTNR